MKKLIYIGVVFLLWSCNSENAPDCFQNSGEIIQQEFSVPEFNKITVLARVALIVKQDDTPSVIVETGENLLNDIDVKVENNTLILTNNNACNLTRDYNLTKIYVSAPNLVEIRNGSEQSVTSDGVLAYDTLQLVSEDFNTSFDVNTSGLFDVQVNCTALRCTVNNLSTMYISGQAENLFVGFYSGDARFEGRQLIAEHVEIFQRSSNDMIINPQQSITGEIRSTGDVISVNMPSEIDVEEFYTGQLIFE